MEVFGIALSWSMSFALVLGGAQADWHSGGMGSRGDAHLVAPVARNRCLIDAVSVRVARRRGAFVRVARHWNVALRRVFV